MTYIDVHTDNVVAAGQNTSATSGGWQAWANTSDQTLHNSSAAVRDATVSGALETYAGGFIPAMHNIAQRVDNVGKTTASAANVVTNGDGRSTTVLTPTGQQAETTGSTLSRPINV